MENVCVEDDVPLGVSLDLGPQVLRSSKSSFRSSSRSVRSTEEGGAAERGEK